MLYWVVFDRYSLCELGLNLFSVVNDVEQVSVVSNTSSLFSCLLFLIF